MFLKEKKNLINVRLRKREFQHLDRLSDRDGWKTGPRFPVFPSTPPPAATPPTPRERTRRQKKKRIRIIVGSEVGLGDLTEFEV